MMRRKELRGAKAWIGAECVIRSRMVCKFSGRKTSVLLRLVKRRVLEGGVGCERGGSFERSRVRPGDRRLEEEEDREDRVVLSEVSMVRMVCVVVVGEVVVIVDAR
jgi:hypothetical protein